MSTMNSISIVIATVPKELVMDPTLPTVSIPIASNPNLPGRMKVKYLMNY